MISISASVGLNGANRSNDVRTIQEALNQIAPFAGGPVPSLKVDGIGGTKTRGAILKFQKENLGLIPDGKVDPGGSTLGRINFILSGSTTDPKTLAMADMTISRFWANLAIAALRNTTASSVRAALNTHFHLNNGKQPEAVYLQTIHKNYTGVLLTFGRAAQVFRARNNAQAAADQGVDSGGVPFPAYTFFAGSVNFTSTFRPWNGTSGFGPMCRAAMVLHEPIHFIDFKADGKNDFYEHGPLYATLTADQAVHNPSSYVCFAEQMAFGADVRFGAGKPAL
jgi:peptidoglycan hydrolase-like protein with peptidoglycan-binding domain